MRHLRKISVLFCFFLISQYHLGQKTISIVTSGNGTTYDEAKNNALRSGLEQVAGIYFSSKLEIKNNIISTYDIKRIVQGTIKNYKIISKTSSNGLYHVTLKSFIKKQNFVNFINQNSKNSVKINGDVFIANLTQSKLNIEAEKMALQNLKEICEKEIMNFYKIKLRVGEPTVSGEKVFIELKLTMKLSRKFKKFRNWLVKTIFEIGIKQKDIKKMAAFDVEIYDFKHYQRFSANSLVPKDKYTRWVMTRNDLRDFFKPYMSLQMSINDGISKWKCLSGNEFYDWGKIRFENNLYYEYPQYRENDPSKRKVNVEGIDSYNITGIPSLLYWPLPRENEKCILNLRLWYTPEEFQNIKGFKVETNN